MAEHDIANSARHEDGAQIGMHDSQRQMCTAARDTQLCADDHHLTVVRSPLPELEPACLRVLWDNVHRAHSNGTDHSSEHSACKSR